MNRFLKHILLLAIMLTALSPAQAFARGHHWRRHHRRHSHSRHHVTAAHGHLRQHGNRFMAISSDVRYPSSANDLAKVALHDVGSRKFTPFAGNWCRDAVNSWLRRAGYRTDSSRLALDAIRIGHRLRGPQVGALGVLRRRGGGHVGVIVAMVRQFVEMVAGNSTHGLVAVEHVPRSRFAAFVQPVKL
jgi:hypothetical protein